MSFLNESMQSGFLNVQEHVLAHEHIVRTAAGDLMYEPIHGCLAKIPQPFYFAFFLAVIKCIHHVMFFSKCADPTYRIPFGKRVLTLLISCYHTVATPVALVGICVRMMELGPFNSLWDRYLCYGSIMTIAPFLTNCAFSVSSVMSFRLLHKRQEKYLSFEEHALVQRVVKYVNEDHEYHDICEKVKDHAHTDDFKHHVLREVVYGIMESIDRHREHEHEDDDETCSEEEEPVGVDEFIEWRREATPEPLADNPFQWWVQAWKYEGALYVDGVKWFTLVCTSASLAVFMVAYTAFLCSNVLCGGLIFAPVFGVGFMILAGIAFGLKKLVKGGPLKHLSPTKQKLHPLTISVSCLTLAAAAIWSQGSGMGATYFYKGMDYWQCMLEVFTERSAQLYFRNFVETALGTFPAASNFIVQVF